MSLEQTQLDSHAGADISTAPPANVTPNDIPPVDDGRKPAGLVIGGALVVAALVVTGILPRLSHHAQLANSGAEQPMAVSYASVKPLPSSEALDIPGDVQAVDQTSIVARAGGYVLKWTADIGDQVKAGQTLAVIDTPELDQQLLQAKAQLMSARAALVQTQANVGELRAKVAEAQSNIARSQAMYEQSETEIERAQVDLAHSTEAVARQDAQVVEAQASVELAKVTSQRYQAMLADQAIDEESADQAAATFKTSSANLDALKAAERAAKENVKASQDAIISAQSNARAYASALSSSRSSLEAARENVKSGEANISAAQANVQENQANVARISVLQAFNKVTAPFTGVITARNIDTGSLVTANANSGSGNSSVGSGIAGTNISGGAASGSSLNGPSSSTGGQGSLFSLAKLDSVRVYLNVPENDADSIHYGQHASVTASAVPGRSFVGTIVRTSNALDPVSRTLIAEVRVPNPAGLLRPGMFADVRLRVPSRAGAVLIPDAALVTIAQGSEVELIQPDGHVHFQPVTVGRDFGKEMEITSGLTVGQHIVASVNDAVREGEQVVAASGD